MRAWLAAVVGGVGLASLKELSFTWLGFIAAMVSNVASALPVSHPARRKLAILSVAPILAHHMAEIAGLPAPEIDPATPVFSMHGFSDARECPHPPPSPPPLPPL